MQNLVKLELTESEKSHLTLKSRDGVCVTKNAHECPFGWIFYDFLSAKTVFKLVGWFIFFFKSIFSFSKLFKSCILLTDIVFYIFWITVA